MVNYLAQVDLTPLLWAIYFCAAAVVAVGVVCIVVLLRMFDLHDKFIATLYPIIKAKSAVHLAEKEKDYYMNGAKHKWL